VGSATTAFAPRLANGDSHSRKIGHGETAFRVNAANFSGAIVDVEISRQVRKARQCLHRVHIAQKVRR
jgi:hypothetical protein